MCTTCGCGQAEVSVSHGHDHGHDHDHVHHHHHHQGPLGAAHEAGLSEARMIEIEENILAKNDAVAAHNRAHFAQAGVLALEPQILVLDEPTAGLDPMGRKALLQHLQLWKAQEERAIVLTTHNMDDVALLADRIYVLVDGRVVRSGPPRQIFGDPAFLLQHGLGLPSATEVVQALARRGCSVPAGLLTLEEVAEAVGRLAYERV